MRTALRIPCLLVLLAACDGGPGEPRPDAAADPGNDAALPDLPVPPDPGRDAVLPPDVPDEAPPPADVPADVARDVNPPADTAPDTPPPADLPPDPGDAGACADCAAPACWGTPACTLCTPRSSLACGDVVAGDPATGDSGLNGYACHEEYLMAMAGPEAAHAFASAEAVGVRVSYRSTSGFPDDGSAAVVLQGTCHPQACLAATPMHGGLGDPVETAFQAEAGRTYFLVVDRGIAGGPYELRVACHEDPHCADGRDNDGDGVSDCGDPDCGAADACLERPDCANGRDDDDDGATDCDDADCAGAPPCFCLEAVAVAACDTSLEADHAGLAGVRTLYACGDDTLDRPETVYAFTAPETNDVRVVYEGLFYSGQVVLLDAACDPDSPSSCLAATPGFDTTAGLTFAAQQGTTYHLVVESGGTYRLSFACRRIEACDDGLDNDLDGFTDCYDATCRNPNEDPSTWFPACRSESSCADNRDNDGDGARDCQDPDCDGKVGFPGGQPCEFLRERSCHDGVDNDWNSLFDCQDIECLEECHEWGDECSDGMDNDRDTRPDCQDPDCAGELHCTERDCGDGVDGPDADSLVDCDDPDCAKVEPCGEQFCADGLDGDTDGLTDCADRDCDYEYGPGGCQCFDEDPDLYSGVCGNGCDDDGDGLTDCDDPQCACR